jgi:two-component system, NtrC family, sensor histidine kinase HydH
MSRSWFAPVRAQDFVWLGFFGALAAFSPNRDPMVLSLLGALGIVQVLEPRIGAVASVVLKLGLCYPLLYFGGGIGSSFYLVLFLPVISAATSFGLIGTTAATFAACGMYLSFLALLEERNQYVPSDQVGELILRVLFLPVVGFLTNQLAEENRQEAAKLQATAAELAKANESLKSAEADVRRADRLAALGQLTAGLAHELRNPLATMRSSAEMLSRRVALENEIAREMAANITAEVDRTGALITRFLDFARPRSLQMEVGDIHAMLDRAIDRFQKSGPTVSVFKNYSPDVPPIRFDGAMMEQVMLNLLANAAQASPVGGVVTIKTQRVERSVWISVIDRGSGIEPKNLESIFNPFFTTKAEGVGLGLAVVSKIVEEHGGDIRVESSLGEGSVFLIRLPMEA